MAVRICDKCGKAMTQGYLVDGAETYCGQECCVEAIGAGAWAEAQAEWASTGDCEYLFWTDWTDAE